MTPGRGLALAERPPPPPGPKPFEELVGIAWPHEVKQASRSLNPRRRRVRVVWSGGIQYNLKAWQGQIRAFKECQKKRTRRVNTIKSSVLAFAGHSSILAAAGSEHQSLLSQDLQQSLLPQDPLFSPCADRTFNNPCCRRIHSSVLALTGPSPILAAAGSTPQSLR
ncbi:hypothetical protein ACLKA6_018819 [Drosophila palustris]